jgi:hypothetical protein
MVVEIGQVRKRI